MTKLIYLVCGVPASGKTWICRQLTDKYTYLPHDDYIKRDHLGAIAIVSASSKKPIITEIPFGERLVKEQLEARGFSVKPFFAVEEPHIIAQRYIDRGGKGFPPQHATRAVSIKDRAIEWLAPYGTSAEVLEMLRKEET